MLLINSHMPDMISILPPRLRAIACLIPHGCAVADIGTDHALLAVALAISEHARKIIASDNRPGPLASAQATLHRFSCTSRVELRCADGLAAFSVGEVDTLVLAGMGAYTMLKILTEGQTKLASLQTIIVQANRGWELLRCFMADWGLGIAEERLVPDGRYLYVVIKFSRDCQDSVFCQNRADQLIGPKLRQRASPELRRFLHQELGRCQQVLESMKKANASHGEKFAKLEKMQKIFQSELRRWQYIPES